MIDIEDVLKIHEFLINKFGGSQGIRDMDLLKSAIGRPFQTFDKKDLYGSPIEKSAAIIERIVSNHPFIDGNKRIGYVWMRLFLMEQGRLPGSVFPYPGKAVYEGKLDPAVESSLKQA